MYVVVVPIVVLLFHNSVHRCIYIRASSYVSYFTNSERGPHRTFDIYIYMLNPSNHYLYQLSSTH